MPREEEVCIQCTFWRVAQLQHFRGGNERLATQAEGLLCDILKNGGLETELIYELQWGTSVDAP